MNKKIKSILYAVLIMAIVMTLSVISVSADDGINTAEELKSAITAAESGAVITLTGDIELNEMVKIEKAITIDGQGEYTISSPATVRKTFEVYASAAFKDVSIVNTYTGDGRCIDTRVGGITLTLTNPTLKSTAGVNSQPLNIGGNAKSGDEVNPINVNITGSTVSAALSGYGITTFNPVAMTIDNSTISGYAALNMKGPDGSVGSVGSVVEVKNSSVLKGFNPFIGKSNSFCTITLEDSNITVTVDETSKVVAESSGDQTQSIVSVNIKNEEHVTNNKVVIKGDIELAATGSASVKILHGYNTEAKHSVTVSEKYAEVLRAEGFNMNTVNGESTIICDEGKHVLTKTDAKAATCTEDGNTEYYTCSVCNVVFSDAEGKTAITLDSAVVPAAHTLTRIDAKEATYTAAGNIEYYVCSECGKLYADAEGKTEITDKNSVVLPKLVEKVDKVENPDTGGNSFVMIFAGVMTVSLMAIVSLLLFRKRECK